ncbi:hypothetical protein Nepgr_026116 [Nepenthes gracilis]|uniref:Transcription factor MYC/MYB N-terminal domain-containing protein n=1 Tax=Nepenthes gracilis TaxID=150966 RepID=A0AAD3T695_NEPGR|nr:hypothetical protein Nepgr_026116 [Nepenthes gracilis]
MEMMTGSGALNGSKEAVGMMALHEALRNVCLSSDWTYSVFWTIRPRPRVRGGNGCRVGDGHGSLMLMWEDGFYRGTVPECLDQIAIDDPVRRAFSKMSIQLYNYGEGLMGKVASDKCHKWVFKEPTEREPNNSNYQQSSFDAIPTDWTDQFESGIQTIAVIQAHHGLLQLGSCKIIPEDLHFVLKMRQAFESIGYQSGFYHSQIFSSSIPPKQPEPVFNWHQQLMTPQAPALASPNFECPLGFPSAKGKTCMHSVSHSLETTLDQMIENCKTDINCQNGPSIYNALNQRTDDAMLFFDPVSLESRPDEDHYLLGENPNQNPARMMLSSSSTSLKHHALAPEEYRNSQASLYAAVMEMFLDG